MIDITDFQGKHKQDFIDAILDEKKQPIEIAIPKSTQQYFSESGAIAWDYAMLAYCGQLLSNDAVEFNYKNVSPQVHESVVFTLKTKNIEGIAAALYNISFGYVNDVEDSEYEEGAGCDFAMNVEQFIYEIENGKVEPICKYFLEVYRSFNEESVEPNE